MPSKAGPGRWRKRDAKSLSAGLLQEEGIFTLGGGWPEAGLSAWPDLVERFEISRLAQPGRWSASCSSLLQWLDANRQAVQFGRSWRTS